MDRQTVYPGQIPLETDLLNTNRNTLIGLGFLAQDILGQSTIVSGLACTPKSPAALNVLVAPGRIYSLQNLDATAYSSLAADTTHSLVKQGISLDTVQLACAAPATSGYSVNYLIQAAFSEVDANSVLLPYYNSNNPAQPYSGPNNSGSAQYTARKGTIVLTAKAGVAAATGTQTTPSADSGNVGLWVVTVANGQTTITSGNIVQVSGAPFITNTLTMLAPLASPAFTGTPTAPTPGVGDNSTKVATTAFVTASTVTPVAILGAARNLVMSSTGASALVALTADELLVKDASGNAKVLSSVSMSASTASTGAGGLDTGTIAVSTWYSVWVIAKTDGTMALLLSLSSTAPTMPTGYTFKARVGWIRTDGTANKYPLGFLQYGHRVQYKVAAGTNLTALPSVASGVQGSLTTPTLVPITMSAIPPTAFLVLLSASQSMSTGGTWTIAPNNSYGAPNSTTNKPPAVVTVGSGAQLTYAATTQVAMIMETAQTIYVASDAAVNNLALFGWEDI